MWWLLLFPILYILSFFFKPVNYLCKQFMYATCFFIIAILHLIYCPFFPKNRDNTYVLAPIFYWLGHFVTGITVEVEGTENLEIYDGGYILCPNHQSALDTLCMAKLWPHRAIVMMKKSLLFVPLFGLAAYLSGHEFIQRGKGASKDVKDHMSTINERIKKERLRVWIFPEGTRNKNPDKMLPFKKGGFHMAQQSQAPIVPVVISSVKNVYDKKNWLFKSGTIKAKILEPVFTDGLTPDDVTALTESVQKKMQDTLNEMNKSV